MRWLADADAALAAEKARLVGEVEKQIESLRSDFRDADEPIDDPDLSNDIGQSVVLEGYAIAIQSLQTALAKFRKGGRQ